MGNPTLQAIPGNTALDLGPYVCDQPADNPGGCAHITDYGKLVYDATAHQVLMWGGGHAGNYASNVMRFDLQTLAWGSENDSTTCANQVADNFDPVTASWKDTQSPTARHTWDMMSIAEVNGARSLVILTSGGIGGYESCNPSPGEPVPASGKPMSYGIDAKAWSFGTTAADTLWYYASAQETDPVSGQVLVLATWPSLELYDPDSGEVANVDADFSAIDVNDLGYSNNLVYFPPSDRFYYLTRNTPVGVYEVAFDRDAMTATIVEVATSDAPDNPNETGWAYDATHEIIGGGVIDGKFLAFDPVTKSWVARTMVVDSPDGATPDVAFHALDFDPVNGVFLFVSQTSPRTWAYRFE
jgi:hypothetical protein